MNIEQIKASIDQLENGETTFNACSKLADLYIVYEHLTSASESQQNPQNQTENELMDILPSYHNYVAVKGKYQRHETTMDEALYALRLLVQEIEEFFIALYSGTDCEQERNILREMLQSLDK